jgi:uncharacterized protein (TIGR02996 family)
MPTPDELLAEIVRNPDDDAPRLAYADAVAPRAPERAELVRLQIERFHSERQRGLWLSAPSARETAILEQHGPRWAHFIAPFARGYSASSKFQGYAYERGFVALLRTEPDMVADMGDRLLKMAPIQHLDLTRNGPFIPALTAPCLGRMRSLNLSQLSLTDDDAVALAERGHLDRCEWLDLSNNKIWSRGVEALLASPAIRRIPLVKLAGNPGDPTAVFLWEEDGALVEGELPGSGRTAEERYGRIPWLHIPVSGAPDRYHGPAAASLP